LIPPESTFKSRAAERPVMATIMGSSSARLSFLKKNLPARKKSPAMYISANDSEKPPARKKIEKRRMLFAGLPAVEKRIPAPVIARISEIRCTPVADTQNQTSILPSKKKKKKNEVMKIENRCASFLLKMIFLYVRA
jgi:hypothetical protein